MRSINSYDEYYRIDMDGFKPTQLCAPVFGWSCNTQVSLFSKRFPQMLFPTQTEKDTYIHYYLSHLFYIIYCYLTYIWKGILPIHFFGNGRDILLGKLLYTLFQLIQKKETERERWSEHNKEGWCYKDCILPRFGYHLGAKGKRKTHLHSAPRNAVLKISNWTYQPFLTCWNGLGWARTLENRE